MNFSIKETPNHERMERINKVYEGVKKDYQKGINIGVIKAAYGINNNQWYKTYVPLLKMDGLYDKRKRKNTNIGVRNVRKVKSKRYGLIYRYVLKQKDGRVIARYSKDINILKDRIIDQGLEWVVLDEELVKSEGLVL